MLQSLKNESKWSNCHLYRNSWAEIYKMLVLIQFKMVDGAIICNVILLLLKLHSLYSLFFRKPLHLVPKCDHFLTVIGWLDYTKPLRTTVIFARLYKHFNFKRKQKQVMWVLQEDHHKLLRNRLFQIKWINFNFSYLSNRVSYENESWMSKIRFQRLKYIFL